MKFPTYEEMAKDVAEKALDNFLFDGKSIREWMQIIVSEDAISRQAVQDYIAKYLSQYLYNDVREAVEVIDEYIGELPSVNPQESKTDVLDKIRAEIESNRNEWIKGKDPEWHTYDRCLSIIDKYRGEES